MVFLANYVIPIKGNCMIARLLKENPYQSLLNKIQNVDWAHAVTIVANSADKWNVL